MIIVHQNNVAGFAGNHTFYWPFQALFLQQIALRVVTAERRVASPLESVSDFDVDTQKTEFIVDTSMTGIVD